MSLVEEDTTQQPCHFAQLLSTDPTADDLWQTVAPLPIPEQFSLLCFHFSSIPPQNKRLVAVFAAVLARHVLQPQWIDILLANSPPTILSSLLSLSRKLTNILSSSTPFPLHSSRIFSFLLPASLCSSLSPETSAAVFSLTLSPHDHHSGLASFVSSPSCSPAALAATCAALPPSFQHRFLVALLPLLSPHPEECNSFLSLRDASCTSSEIALFSDVFDAPTFPVAVSFLRSFATHMCRSPAAPTLISLLFSRFSSSRVIVERPASFQRRLATLIVFLLRCTPFSARTSLLSDGVSGRMLSPLSRLRSIAAVLIEEIKTHSARTSPEFCWDFDTTPPCFDGDVESDDEHEEQEEGTDDKQDNNYDQQYDENNATDPTPSTLLEWMDALDEFETKTVDEVSCLMACGAAVLSRSSSFVSVYIPDLVRTILVLRNRYRLDDFEQHQIEMLCVLCDAPAQAEESAASQLVAHVASNTELVLRTMLRAGRRDEWVRCVRSWAAEWSVAAREEDVDRVVLCFEYLKEWCGVEVVPEWVVLYKAVHSNDTLVCCVLAALLHVVSLSTTSLFAWECSECVPTLVAMLREDCSNNPDKTIRRLATALASEVKRKVVELENDNENWIE